MAASNNTRVVFKKWAEVDANRGLNCDFSFLQKQDSDIMREEARLAGFHLKTFLKPPKPACVYLPTVLSVETNDRRYTASSIPSPKDNAPEWAITQLVRNSASYHALNEKQKFFLKWAAQFPKNYRQFMLAYLAPKSGFTAYADINELIAHLKAQASESV